MAILLGLLPLLAGCAEEPRAPVLTNETVFRSDALGLTLVVPDGWVLHARGEPPPGRYDRPMRFAAYQSTEGPRRANLELYALDLPDSQGLLTYLATRPIGPEKWIDQGAPTSESINGVAATRYLQAGGEGRTGVRRELVEFRRPGRTYLFVATYHTSDARAREQVHRAIETIRWD